MNTNYYQTLEIGRDSTQEQIAHAFRRLSQFYHPSKNPSSMAANEAKFATICEAYEVLSNHERKAVYDMYGEYGLKTGVENHLGQKIGGYTFLGNSDEIFEKHFAEQSDPLSRDFEVEGTDVYGSLLGDGHKAKNEAPPPAPADIEVELGCTLKELYCGCLKTVKYTFSKIHANARTITQAEDETMVELKPGSRAGTVLTFSRKGNQQYMHHPSNLKVKLVQVDDANDENTNKFMRRDNDLIYTHKMTLKDALASSPVKINTLDGRVCCVNMDVLITPQTVHRIVGEGMPIYEEGKLEPGQLTNHLKPFGALPRGDLYVRFDIHFPEQLPAEKKAKIAALLQQAN